jgi:pyruvate formate lyase activating enzyme
MLTGMIFDIKQYAINDGPGIRTTVFFKGCPLSCWWCHNPESQSRSPELIYRANRCTLCAECVGSCPHAAISVDTQGRTDLSLCDNCGSCAEVCFNGARELLGHEMSVAQVMQAIERDVLFFDTSHGGVTFSGGEPLLQRKFLAELLRLCRAHEIHTVVDTSGYAAWDAFDSLRADVNLFLYDLKLMDDTRHRRYTGVSNHLILNNLKMLSEQGHELFIRIPLIPGINDDLENLRQTGEFLAALKNISTVELMGYHDIAQSKYQALGLDYRLPGTQPPSPESMQTATGILAGFGLNVKQS